MNKILYIFSLLMIFTLSAFSQTEVAKDSVQLQIRTINSDAEQFMHSDQSDQVKLNENYNHSPSKVVIQPSSPSIQFELPSNVDYKGPSNMPTLFDSRNPYANDYTYSGVIHGFSQNAWIVGNSYIQSYPAMGRVKNSYATFNYKVTDQLYLSGSPYLSKFEYNGFNYNDYGVNGALRFMLNDRFSIKGYGQYSGNSKHNMVSPNNGMFPGTYYGGSIEVKITNVVGIETGIVREFNPLTRKWDNIPFVKPVFYLNK